jgi:hypothetical protein
LGVTADVTGSILLTFVSDGSGITLTNSASSAATLPFSTVKMYGGSVPTNVTKTLTGVASFDLATPFDVRVDIANSTSANYTLTALLATPDATNTWLIGATNISAGVTATTLTALGAYATPTSYTLHLSVLAATAAETVNNTIGFTAVGN